ncbi:restriction endonuclease subunit S [Helicobacter pylori]|uniref:restriction endonuclease subunit S n=1 Tax=Helicobacter pylori TaxID=210 RepID=UPI0039DFF2C0
MSDNKTYKLKNIGKIVTGKTPKTSNLDFFNGKYMFITPNDLHGTYRIIKTPRTLSDSGLKSIQNNTIDNTSILVGCIGDVGIIRMCFDKCATNQQINSITDIKDFCNPYYLYYYLSNKKELFKNIALSTVVPIIPKTIFQEIEVLLPNIETQQKIARTLSILDQKIENNHKINELLHKILELLYEQYFVRFDFLDENNKPYQTSGGKMKFSKELNRLIPSGWSVRFLNHKIVSTYQPKTISKTLLNDSYSYSVYGGGGIIGRFTEYNHEQSEFIISCRGQCGISYLTLPKSWITGNAMVIRPTKSYTSKTYLYHTIKKYKLTNYITGSVQPQITRQNLSTMPILIPKRKTLNKWNNISSLLWNLIHNNMQSTQTLTALRDFLLPLLLTQQVKPQ